MRRNVDTKDGDVVCPFFKWADRNHVACEGVCQGNTTSLVFGDPNTKKKYMDDYCTNIDGYKDCCVCEMLMEKYADDGK